MDGKLSGSFQSSSGGSGGTVTAVTATAPLASSGGATPNITLTGTPVGGVNSQVANYNVVAGDAGKIIDVNAAGAVTIGLPSPPPSATFAIFVQSLGAGLTTITPAGGLTIDGNANVTLAAGANQGVYVSTDGVNYFTARGKVIPATTTRLGSVIPDGVTIDVAVGGGISVPTAIIGASAIGAAGSLAGASAQSSAAKSAAAAQEQAATTASNTEQNMFNTAVSEQQPFINAGKNAIPTLEGLLGTGPGGPGAMTDILKNVPGFNFISDLAQKGVSNQGTVTGLGGNTLLAGANAGTNVALSSAWNPIVNSLMSLVQSGSGAAGNVGQQAVQTGANVAGSTMNVGNAIAGGATGAAGNIGNSLTTAALLSKLTNPSTPTSMYGNFNPSNSNFSIPNPNAWNIG